MKYQEFIEEYWGWIPRDCWFQKCSQEFHFLNIGLEWIFHQVWLLIQSNADLSASTSGFILPPHWKWNDWHPNPNPFDQGSTDQKVDSRGPRDPGRCVDPGGPWILALDKGQQVFTVLTSISYINVSLYRSLQFIRKFCCFSSFKASPNVRYKSTLFPKILQNRNQRSFIIFR